MAGMKWFRLYAEAVDDEKLRLLAFEDRWHFVALLCLKASGVLDENSGEMLRRKVAIKLGLSLAELDSVAKRLADIKLIDRKTLQPLAWDERQFASDTSRERTRAYRERMKRHGDVTVTAQDTDTDTDTESDTETEEKQERAKARNGPPDSVSAEVWKAFLTLRKAQRAPISQLVIDGIRREAGKAGIGIEDAMRICCERGWRGFKAEWVQEKPPRQVQARPASKAEQFMDSLYGKTRDAGVIDEPTAFTRIG
jgi:hypothetical protein